jgi:hypothetical protein
VVQPHRGCAASLDRASQAPAKSNNARLEAPDAAD